MDRVKQRGTQRVFTWYRVIWSVILRTGGSILLTATLAPASIPGCRFFSRNLSHQKSYFMGKAFSQLTIPIAILNFPKIFSA